MPALLTRADSLREYLTGAASDGGVQTNPAASFGNFRSSTEAISFNTVITNGLANVSIDFVAGGNIPGNGTLVCVDVNDVAWNDNGEAQGSPLFLAGSGSQGIVEASGNPGAFLRITRTSASAISGGPATVTLTIAQDNYFGFDDVSASQASAGEQEYRCSYLKNVSVGTVQNVKRWIAVLGIEQTSDVTRLGASGAGTIATSGSFASWPQSGWCRIMSAGGTLREVVYYTSRTVSVLTVPAAGRARLGTAAAAGLSTDLLDAVPGVAMAIDTAGVQSSGTSVQTIANANTPPTTVTWNLGITPTTGLNIGNMLTGQQVGIWLWRDIPAGASSTPLATIQLNNSFDAA